MPKYLIRLDDASEYMDADKWERIEKILDRYEIKPIFGIIPDNQDSSLISKYQKNQNFWEKMHGWKKKGWIPAMHGCEHKYVTNEGGINPVNERSEFAGLPFNVQEEKIERGWNILKSHGFTPEIFFAPSHTFDSDTLKALESKTSIRVISDTIASDVYKDGNFWFIPQQSGNVRKLPFKLVTFCYHPNTMDDASFIRLENFIKKNYSSFIDYNASILVNRHLSCMDSFLRKLYFMKH